MTTQTANSLSAALVLDEKALPRYTSYPTAPHYHAGIVGAATPARAVRFIHWGGGTPSLLGPARLKGLWRALGDAFELSSVEEHAIELDLMYGLPEQTNDDVERTTSLGACLDPSRLAIFGYAHVPWFKAHLRLIDAWLRAATARHSAAV